jgi:hypothetical protein
MAVQSDTSSISYTGNNSTVTTYAVPFVFLENSHLAATAKVIATGVESAVTLTNHTGAGNANGGTVRTAVAVPATSTLTIFRTVPATQTTTYQEGGDFPAASHERALDKLTLIAQQNERAASRSIKVTEADGARNEMTAVANSIVGLDANKQPKAMTLLEVKTYLALSGVTLDVNAGMKTFADAGERALAVPDFTGQLGTQRDTADIYISTGTAAGNWALVEENMSLADFAFDFFTADATGRGKFGGGFVDAGLLASDAVTTAKIVDANVTDAKLASGIDASKITTGTLPADRIGAGIDASKITTGTLPADRIGANAITTARILDANVTPSKLSQPFTLATSVATTSGTSVDFTDIPSWVKRITVIFDGVSTNGSSLVQVQIGSGSFTTSGYVSTGTTSGATIGSTSGFITVYAGAAAYALHGTMQIYLISGTTYVASSVIAIRNSGSAFNVTMATGSVALGGALDRVRITTVNGTDTFDAGEVNIMYEG